LWRQFSQRTLLHDFDRRIFDLAHGFTPSKQQASSGL
jgi:hypothetical protein